MKTENPGGKTGDKTENKTENKIKNKTGNKKNRKRVKLLVALAALGAVAALVLPKVLQAAGEKAAGQGEGLVNTGTVTRMDLAAQLASSGTLKPKDTYSVTSLVEGEVTSADFQAGDQVKKGQVLYGIDVTSAKSEMDLAAGSLERSEASYRDAAKDLKEMEGKFAGNVYRSPENGYVKALAVKEGEKVGTGTKIADLYDDRTMKLKLPFLSADAAHIPPGSQAVVTLAATQEQLAGVVEAVSGKDETLTGGRIVRYVTMQVANPGGLSAQQSATAAVGEYVCSMEGTFAPMLETSLVADLPDSVTVEKMLVAEGDYLQKGAPVFRLEGRSAEKLLRTYRDALGRAKENLQEAKSKLAGTKNSLENYTITAPISGTVIKKNVKAGDKVSKNGEASVMAVIYDLSSITFSMSIDEMEVEKVKVGQRVDIKADAVPGKAFSGTVTNVSLESSTTNGVTTYPVTVTVADAKGLLPGMNVNGKILLAQSPNALVIPVDALMRGNVVYVKDDSANDSTGLVPPGFKEVKVETGIVGDSYVEIKSGLSEGEVVYRDPSTVSQPGAPGGQEGAPDQGAMDSGAMDPGAMDPGAMDPGGTDQGAIGF